MFFYQRHKAQQKKRKQILERQILEVCDAEKQRIARDLHDGLGQYFSAILTTSNAIRKVFRDNDLDKEIAFVERMILFVEECTQSMRKITHGLSLMHLQGYELKTALEEICEITCKMYNTPCVLDYDDDLEIYGFEAITHIYRIAQEAVRNAIYHGKAQQIRIQVTKEEQYKLLKIIDNGNGLGKKNLGLGILSMQSRAKILGGNLKIKANSPQGVIVWCEF